MSSDRFTLSRRTYKDRAGVTQESACLYVDFRDHQKTRQRWPLEGTEKACREIANKLVRLVELRQMNDSPPPELFKWLDTLPADLTKRITDAGLIDAGHAARHEALTVHLEGKAATKDEAGKEQQPAAPGYRQHLEAKGGTREHVNQTVGRVRRIIDGCAFATWQDVCKPGAATRIRAYVAGLQKTEDMASKTAGYYLREFRGFAAWMKGDNRATYNPIEGMEGISHEGAEDEQRRALSVDEMLWLLATTHAEKVTRFKMPAADRVLLYNFAYETGIRPMQIRSLTAANVQLDADPPVIVTSAKYVKRRRRHEQPITPRMVHLLRPILENKMPGAPLFPTMANRHRLAKMIQQDLAAARAAWVKEAGQDAAEQLRRQRSDFLELANRQGDRADFYSLRHTHGQTLGDGGASQKDIAASLHHAATSTTDRYTRRTTGQAKQRTVGSLPDVLPQVLRLTGTDAASPRQPVSPTKPKASAKADDDDEPAGCCPAAAPIVRSSTELDGQYNPVRMPGNAGLVAELADATDSKSVSNFQKHGENRGSQVCCPAAAPTDPDLLLIVDAWPTLSAEVRQMLVGMVRLSRGRGRRRGRGVSSGARLLALIGRHPAVRRVPIIPRAVRVRAVLVAVAVRVV